MMYKICSLCGARLDPEERCDCTKEKTVTVESVKHQRKGIDYEKTGVFGFTNGTKN